MGTESSETILEDYANSLNELTFNSRPIIDNLTTIAKENVEVAEGILNTIVKKIQKSIPEQKLFVLYLLDSICKTVGKPYNNLVGDDIFHLYSHVFQLVDDPVRQKLLNLFETWRVTKAKGTSLPLFPRDQLKKIEIFLFKAGYSKKNTDQINKNVLINEANKLISIFQIKFNNSPSPKLKDRCNALAQLKTLILNHQMNSSDLQAVQTQLNMIKKQEQITNLTASNGYQNNFFTSLNVNIVCSKAESLFEILVSLNLVIIDQLPIENSKPVYSLVFPKVKYKKTSNDAIKELLNLEISKNFCKNDYEKLKIKELSFLFNHENIQNFINTSSFQMSFLLYGSKPIKCSMCGKRFTSDVEGTKKKKSHFDWHFRLNKKQCNLTVITQSRNWFLDDYEWVMYKDKPITDTINENENNDRIKFTNQSNVKNKPSYVVVPSDNVNTTNKCIICHEIIKTTYNDEIGEWCWIDCVKISEGDNPPYRIIHTNCYNETNKKRNLDDKNSFKSKRERF